MTTLVHLAGYLRTLGGRTPLTDGDLVIEYVVGSEGYLVVAGEDVTVPAPIRVKVTDGEPAVPLTLEPTRGACAVRWGFRAPGYQFERHTAIPDVPEVDFGDLLDVDPESFEPVDVTPTLIQTIDARLAEQIGPALDAYMDEHPLEGATTAYVDGAVSAHVDATTPHPAYDEDIPSLTLLFENGLV